ncbi:pentapeptide repeat-containing protein [Archangium lansingense]|uniref:Pentapeptide repeat-containing protein n=1 Tax=Archangium lansingense TaxID=2995310 RepID=A0ABT3ZZ65_9BACT|nr:pentapeptide repeat-containing protein [Archangium lansinium]MCY1074699.1 pentapeptide repeat-containing protein [Archangium lansinium]
MRPALLTRWNTPEGRRRRERLVTLGLRGSWREVLVGFPGTAELGDNLGDLRGIDLSGEELPEADLLRARLDGARLDDCGLAEARLDLATLSGASLTWARMERASLVACVALDTRWDDALLEGAVLTASNLARGSFRRTKLRDARLTAASLMKADLRCADLRGADLAWCDLEEAHVACVRRDWPRTYELQDNGLVEYATQAGFSSFLDTFLLPPGVLSLRFLSKKDTLLHVEAALDASPDPGAEILALLKEEQWQFHVVAAAALVLGGSSESTRVALWELLDRWSAAHAQLTVAALLTAPDFEEKARARLEEASPVREEVRDSLTWALHRKTGRGALPVKTPVEGATRAEGWLKALRYYVDPRVQETWVHLA